MKIASRNARDVRARIVGAATDVLARRGAEAVTIKEVAKAAGVSSGLIYYYFEDKDRLMLEVLREALRSHRSGAAGLAVRAPRGSDGLLKDAGRPRTHHRLRHELFVMGLRDPRFLPDLAALLEGDRQEIQQALDGRLSNHSRDVSSLLLACFDGLALQRSADPTLDLDAAYDLLAPLTNPPNKTKT